MIYVRNLNDDITLDEMLFSRLRVVAILRKLIISNSPLESLLTTCKCHIGNFTITWTLIMFAVIELWLLVLLKEFHCPTKR